MRVAVITGPGAVELRDEPARQPGPDEVLVSVGACGLCTLERRVFSGEKRIYPVAPGHEVAGWVAAVGSALDGVPGAPQTGDLVALDLLTRCGACNACRRGRTAMCQSPQGGRLSDGTPTIGSGLTEMLAVPAAHAWSCGDASIEHAAMGEPVACVAHSIRLGGFRAGDRVAVVGGGFMGRLHLAVTRALGAVSSGLVDPDEARRNDARSAGAAWTAAPEDAAGQEREQDLVFVTAGAPGALELAIRLCDVAGTVVLYGAFPEDVHPAVPANALHHREISIVGVYSQEPQDWRTATGWIRSGILGRDLDALITARYRLDEVAQALHLVSRSPTYRVLVGG